MGSTPTAQEVDVVEFPLIDKSAPHSDLTAKPAVPQQDLTAFLKVMYNVNQIFSKFVTVGLFKEFDFHLGVLFHKQGNRKYVLLSHAQFCELQDAAASITYAVRNKIEKRRFEFFWGKVIIRNIYFKRHVEIQDSTNKTSIIFTEQEWVDFVSILPCISRYVEQLTSVETYLIEHIDRVLHSESVYVPPPQQVNGWDADRLHDEIVLYKNTQPTVDSLEST